MTEAAVEQDPHARFADEQGSVIPLSWKPTPSEPVPVVRCTQIKKDGNRCRRWSYRGALKCVSHLDNGGALKNVRAHADAVVEAARLRLLEDTDMAITALEGLLQPGTSEGIILKASTEILDRAGIRGGWELTVDHTVTVNSSELVSERLAKLAEGARAVERMRAEHDAESDVVEGEIVDEQETLF